MEERPGGGVLLRSGWLVDVRGREAKGVSMTAFVELTWESLSESASRSWSLACRLVSLRKADVMAGGD